MAATPIARRATITAFGAHQPRLATPSRTETLSLLFPPRGLEHFQTVLKLVQPARHPCAAETLDTGLTLTATTMALGVSPTVAASRVPPIMDIALL